MTSEYAARIDAYCARAHAGHGCTSRCDPNCKYRGTMINVEELKETAELLTGVTPENTEEMSDVCAELHKAMDAQDELQAAEKQACAELVAQLEAKRAPFKMQLAAAAAVIAAGKAALMRRVEADEAEALAAIAAKRPVPAPRPLPQGLRVSTKTVLVSVELERLGEEYQTVVADADAILRAAEAGLAVEGAVTETKTGVVYTRPRKK